MGDLSQTGNVVITDDNDTIHADINLDNELLVHDQDTQDILQEIADGTGIISSSVTTSWEFFTENNQGFIADFGATFAGGTAEQPFLLLRNPAASGYYLRVKGLILAVTTNTTGTFKLYREPTITVPGTALHIENFRDTAVGGVMQAFSVPTYSATGSSMAQLDVNAGGVGIVELNIELALILLEGDDLLITLAQGSNNNAFSANISWAEEEIPTP